MFGISRRAAVCSDFVNQQVRKTGEKERAQIYQAYLDNTRYINGWDLVDSSTYKIVGKQLLQEDEDLIHRATGWMLREVGNRNRSVEEAFLREHGRDLPRKMLRYAIEKFDAEDRRRYLKPGS